MIGYIHLSDGRSIRPRYSQTVTLLPSDEVGVDKLWHGIGGSPSIKYDRPAEPSRMKKHILLLRAGHNAVVNCRDSGLTEVGVQQLEAASDWLCLLFKSGRLIDTPISWCTAGLTSEWTSIDLTLKESLVVVEVNP